MKLNLHQICDLHVTCVLSVNATRTRTLALNVCGHVELQTQIFN